MKCNVEPGAQIIKVNRVGRGRGEGRIEKDINVSKHILPLRFVFQLAVLVCKPQAQLIHIKFHLVGKQKPQLQEHPSVEHQFPEGCGQLSALTVVEQSAAPTGSGPLMYF